LSFSRSEGQAIIAETAAAFPVDRIGDATLVFVIDHFLEAGDDVRVAVLAKLDHDPAAAHFVGNGAGGAGTGEGVEDEVAGEVAKERMCFNSRSGFGVSTRSQN